MQASGSLDFLDPWGNHVQVVQYGEVQFHEPDRVLTSMGLDLAKTEKALAELRRASPTPARISSLALLAQLVEHLHVRGSTVRRSVRGLHPICSDFRSGTRCVRDQRHRAEEH